MQILPEDPYYKYDVGKVSNKAIITRCKLIKHLAVLGANDRDNSPVSISSRGIESSSLEQLVSKSKRRQIVLALLPVLTGVPFQILLPKNYSAVADRL